MNTEKVEVRIYKTLTISTVSKSDTDNETSMDKHQEKKLTPLKVVKSGSNPDTDNETSMDKQNKRKYDAKCIEKSESNTDTDNVPSTETQNISKANSNNSTYVQSKDIRYISPKKSIALP